VWRNYDCVIDAQGRAEQGCGSVAPCDEPLADGPVIAEPGELSASLLHPYFWEIVAAWAQQVTRM
jgi:hypothetical protein